jgi:hypothetical protein
MTDTPLQPNFEFAMARSQFIDAQASVDLAVIERLRQLKMATKATPSANMNELRKAKPAAQFSKEAKKLIDVELDAHRPIQDIRNALVHGHMTVLKIDGEAHAMFVNVQQPDDLATRAVLLAERQFKSLTKSLDKIAKAIRPA